MDEIYPDGKSVVNELVGIVGILSSRDGSTLRDIRCLVESLHGPTSHELIQGGLKAAVLAGVLECRNRRYKVCKARDISEKESYFSEAGCSSWGTGTTMDTDLHDLHDDALSISSLSTVADDSLGREVSHDPSKNYSVREILSAKSLRSSERDPKSETSLNDSIKKEKKSKGKKHLIVKLPMHNPKSKVVKGGNNTDEDANHSQDVTKEDPNRKNDLPAMRSLGDIMSRVMKQVTELEDIPRDEGNEEGKVNGVEEVVKDEKESNSFDMNKVMTEIMKKVNIEKTDDVKAPEPSRDSEKSEIGSSLGGVMNKVMQRLTLGDVQQSSHKNDVTEPQDVLPSCSTSKIPNSSIRGKNVKPESESINVSNNCRYVTRSRARANELKRSQVSSPSGSESHSKRAKVPQDKE